MTHKNNDIENENIIDNKDKEGNYKYKNVRVPINISTILEEESERLNVSQTDYINTILSEFFKNSNDGESKTEKIFLNLLKENNNDIKKIKTTINDTNKKVNLFYEVLNSYFQAVDQEEIELAFDYYNTKSKGVGKSESLGLIEADVDSYKNQTIERKKDINE